MELRNFKMNLLNEGKRPWLIVKSDNYLVNLQQKSYDYYFNLKLKSVKVHDNLFHYANPELNALFITVHEDEYGKMDQSYLVNIEIQ